MAHARRNDEAGVAPPSARRECPRRSSPAGRDGQPGDLRLRFDLLQSKLTVDPVQRLADREPVVVEVDLGAGMTQCFARTQPHRERYRPERVQPVLIAGVEKAQRLGPGEAMDFSVIGDP